LFTEYRGYKPRTGAIPVEDRSWKLVSVALKILLGVGLIGFALAIYLGNLPLGIFAMSVCVFLFLTVSRSYEFNKAWDTLPPNRSISEELTEIIISTWIMQVVISLVLLAASLYVILSKNYGDSETHWSFATVGTILGYWLKGDRPPPRKTRGKAAPRDKKSPVQKS
jgi:hypothetical protein